MIARLTSWFRTPRALRQENAELRKYYDELQELYGKTLADLHWSMDCIEQHCSNERSLCDTVAELQEALAMVRRPVLSLVKSDRAERVH